MWLVQANDSTFIDAEKIIQIYIKKGQLRATMIDGEEYGFDGHHASVALNHMQGLNSNITNVQSVLEVFVNDN